MANWLTILAICLGFAVNTRAQVPMAGALASYRAQSYTTSAGLLTESLLHVNRLHDGQMLIVGVRGQPLLFDGHRFAPLDYGPHGKFPFDGASATLQTPDRAIWIGGGGGLLRLMDGQLQRIELPAVAIPFSLSLSRDKKRVLVPTRLGVYAVDVLTRQLQHLSATAAVPATAVLEDLQGTLWIGSGDGLYVWSEGEALARAVTEPRLKHVFIWALHLDRFGRVLIATRGLGLGIHQEGQFRFLGAEQGMPHNVVRAIAETDDALWLATAGGGIAHYDERQISLFNSGRGLSSDSVTWITADARGVLWATTAGAGLNRLWPSPFTNFADRAGRRGGFQYALHRDPAGRTWLGSNLGLARLVDGVIEPLGQAAEGQSATVLGLIDAGPDRLYVGSRRGIFRYSFTHGFEPVPNASDIAQPALWNSPRFGRLLASNNQLYELRDNGPHLLTTLEPPDLVIHTMADDVRFGLALATSRGAYGWDGRQIRALGPSNRQAGGFWRDADRLYVSGSGLAALDDGGWHVLIESGDQYNRRSLFGIVPDQLGGVWITSRDGLLRFDRNALRHAVDPLSMPEPTVFTLQDGLPSTEFEGSPQGALIEPDGRIWFASTGGITQLDPSQVGRSPERIELRMHAIENEERRFSAISDIKLPAGTRRVALSFSALPASHSPAVQIRYRLFPVEKSYRDDRGQREAIYGGLAPGHYRFDLQGDIRGLHPVHHQYAYHFSIAPRWIESRAVQWGIGVALLLLLAALPTWHIRALRAQRRRLIAEVADKTSALEVLARTDGLTGLDNRRSFDESLKVALSGAAPCGLLLLDVDHFKRFNDSLGHQAGDVCLRALASAFEQTAALHQARAARVGGEEFAVLQSDSTAQKLASLGSALRTAVADLELMHPATANGRVTISLGAAVSLPGETADALLRRSDAALYSAKHHGRDQLVLV